MSEAAEKTESLRDYAEMLGSPDANTTGRMRARLDEFMRRRTRARRRRVRLAIAAVVLGAAFATALAIGLREDPPHAITAESERAIELGGARLVLRAGASVRTDPADDGRIELLAGELEVTVAGGRSFAVTSGEFEVRADRGRFVVRHTDALPMVTVLRDDAVVTGPGLPAAGVRVLESPTR
jgi:ferric-dicitrate binding protein FerR (iron transport regulator)